MSTDKAIEHANVLGVSSGVNRDGKPFVLLTLSGQAVSQLTPADARKLGTDIIEAGLASMNDAAVFEWLNESTGMTIEAIAAGISHLRKARERVEKALATAPDGVARTGGSDA